MRSLGARSCALIRQTEVDPPAGRVRCIPEQGTIIRISTVPPETEEIRTLNAGQARDVFAGVGNARASTLAAHA